MKPKVTILTNQNSVLSNFLAEIRDMDKHTDSLRFRYNLQRMAEIMAYEISKNLEYTQKNIVTPLGEALSYVVKDKIIVASILRAGLPMHTGFLNYFDTAENAFISAFRKYNKDNTFEIKFEYLSAPDITDKIVILADPMLATGASMVMAYKNLLEHGTPKFTHIASRIASKEGLEYLENNMPTDKFAVWLAALDDELTAKGYIVPGLGDAGDLAFGNKI